MDKEQAENNELTHSNDDEGPTDDVSTVPTLHREIQDELNTRNSSIRSKKNRNGRTCRYKCIQFARERFCQCFLTYEDTPQTHSGTRRQYDCDQCDKTFFHKMNLKRHLTVHTGERAYKCEQCQKTFSLLSSLRKHELIHSGKRPYGCDQCGKTFIQSHHLGPTHPANTLRRTSSVPLGVQNATNALRTNTRLINTSRFMRVTSRLNATNAIGDSARSLALLPASPNP